MRLATPSNLLAAAGVALGAGGFLLPRLVPGVPETITPILAVTALMLQGARDQARLPVGMRIVALQQEAGERGA